LTSEIARESNLAAARLSTPSLGQKEYRQTIADRMEALAIEIRSISDDEMSVVPTEGMLLSVADKIYSARRKVDDIFGMQGFAVSPAWDILLDLYKARVQNKDISVTSACIGAACPSTTGLRWLHALEGMQLIERCQDPDDKRRFVVALTDIAKLKIEDAISAHL
jgi:hypothetical protein